MCPLDGTVAVRVAAEGKLPGAGPARSAGPVEFVEQAAPGLGPDAEIGSFARESAGPGAGDVGTEGRGPVATTNGQTGRAEFPVAGCDALWPGELQRRMPGLRRSDV
ncbi:hypothetical protein JS756_02175 [Streptomyces actuosus]|uniref:Uncharacterized protein n=1 Tax=Streptomyces actuosus TaxID=1885 RepID=A0ABS2VIM1_STRAS|nr:hypothetical protein [Streptomyces actuosus]MBN0042941.1 hypothetical protein [Streptomyces actuosus]